MSTISFQERQNQMDQLEQKIKVLNDNTNDKRLLDTLKRIEEKIIKQENMLDSVHKIKLSEEHNDDFLTSMQTLVIDQIQKQNELVIKIVDNLNNQIQQSQNTQQKMLHDLTNKFQQDLRQHKEELQRQHAAGASEHAKENHEEKEKMLNILTHQLQQHKQQTYEQGEKLVRQMNEMKTDIETHLHKSFDQREQHGLKFTELSDQLQQLSHEHTQRSHEQSEKLICHIDKTVDVDEDKNDTTRSIDQKLSELNKQIQQHKQETQEQTELLYELSNQIQEHETHEQSKKILCQIDVIRNDFGRLEQHIQQQTSLSDDRNDKLDDLLDKVEDRNDKLHDLLEKVDERNDKIDDLLDKVEKEE